MHVMPLGVGLVVLTLAWLGPLPELARHSFAAHMTMHMAVVAFAAPLLALGVSGTALNPAAARPQLFAPIPASLAELAVVWIWHTPVLHHAARHETWALIIEQSSFLAAGSILWIAAIGGRADRLKPRSAAGVAALLFTSMHMTLLGALFAMAPRPLYHITEAASDTLLADQHRGGVIMLLAGGLSYLAGGLWLTADLLHTSRAERQEAS